MYEVKLKDLGSIKSIAIRSFHDLRKTNDMSPEELQQFLIISGLHGFLKSKGIEPGFTVEDLSRKSESDSYESIEDLS